MRSLKLCGTVSSKIGCVMNKLNAIHLHRGAHSSRKVTATINTTYCVSCCCMLWIHGVCAPLQVKLLILCASYSRLINSRSVYLDMRKHMACTFTINVGIFRESNEHSYMYTILQPQVLSIKSALPSKEIQKEIYYFE